MTHYEYKRDKGGALQRHVKTQGTIGGAIAYTGKTWSKWGAKAKAALTPKPSKPREPLSAGTRSQLKLLQDDPHAR
jgi:hypothetical protein